MFGYVMINKGDLKIREFEVYQSFYCGLCRKLKERYGFAGQMTLNYDLTFVVILLTGLYEPRIKKGITHCAIHPVRKQPILVDCFSDYAADMSILLTYYKCIDDWTDEHKADRLLYAKALKGKFEALKASYSQKMERVKELLDKLSEREKKGCEDLDLMAGIFGEIMAEILAWREDEWEESLRRLGFFLGKFIYLCDAYEDLSEDLEKGRYNPFRSLSERADFEEISGQILTMMAAECSREFEKLPIVEYTPILRNILYSGVWVRYEKAKKERTSPGKDHAAKESKSGKDTRKRRKV